MSMEVTGLVTVVGIRPAVIEVCVEGPQAWFRIGRAGRVRRDSDWIRASPEAADEIAELFAKAAHEARVARQRARDVVAEQRAQWWEVPRIPTRAEIEATLP